MKLSISILTVALALGVTATPTPIKRDLASIESALANIATAVLTLDATEQAYTGGDTTTLQTDSDAVVAATNAGTAVANASGALSIFDAIGLVSPIQSLTTDVQNAINDIISIKSAIVAQGAQTQTLNDLIAQNTSATALSAAITAKVPAGLQSIAAQLAAGITNAIEQGIAAYST
ncbi:hypothetical protein OIDMADRAFT_32693 [Oidiodendron maius Zn]|uniref:Cell wall mannoprotein 1 n=1 Tax=Oidiodendron maius (strain Zn) TaxID=913774 RepID=A0A0C3CCW4_OIDMZ|nr:hypothetical protein OIDMADRAFT_32693 [Oidiodendron maius Zn]